MEEKKGLTSKQERFVDEYCKHGNGTRAVIAAGFAAKHSREKASHLLTKSNIREAIETKKAEIAERNKVKQDRVIQELAAIGFCDPRKIMDELGNVLQPHEWPDEIAACISGFDVVETFEKIDGVKTKTGEIKKLKFWNKTDALQQLCALLGFGPNNPDGKPTPKLSIDIAGLQEAVIVATRGKPDGSGKT